MLTGQELEKALDQLPTLYQTGVVFRCVSIEYWQTPLSAVGALENGGRYNIGRNDNSRKAFGALYTSSSPITVLKEIEILLNTKEGSIPNPQNPSVLCSLPNSLNSVLEDICK